MRNSADDGVCSISHLNDYEYEEISIGHRESFSVKVTEEAQSMFLALSGDVNPMHVDEMYAQSQGFRGRLVYGMLTASYYSTLAGTLLPGKKCLFHTADIKFRKPVYIGDQLTVTGECIKKNDAFKLLTIKAAIRNQNNELVSSAELTAGVLDKEKETK